MLLLEMKLPAQYEMKGHMRAQTELAQLLSRGMISYG